MTLRPNRIAVAADAIVLSGPRVLVFERFDKPSLALPCGQAEFGASDVDAAVREVQQLTGIVLEFEDARSFVDFDTLGNNLMHEPDEC